MSGEVVTRTPSRHLGLRFTLVIIGMLAALVVTCIVSITSGQYSLSPTDLIGVLLRGIGIDNPGGYLSALVQSTVETALREASD